MNKPYAPRVPSGRLAIFNLDGCVSDDRWRRAYVPSDPKTQADFGAYYQRADMDSTLVAGSAILANHIANGDFIVFATGRPNALADKSCQWISANFGIQPSKDFIVLLRGDGDDRSAADLKKDFLDFLKNKFCVERSLTIVAAYDNRRDVVQMYRDAGIDATILNEDGEFVPTGSEPAFAPQIMSNEQKDIAAHVLGFRNAAEAQAAFATLNAQQRPDDHVQHPTGENIAPVSARQAAMDRAGELYDLEQIYEKGRQIGREIVREAGKLAVNLNEQFNSIGETAPGSELAAAQEAASSYAFDASKVKAGTLSLDDKFEVTVEDGNFTAKSSHPRDRFNAACARLLESFTEIGAQAPSFVRMGADLHNGTSSGSCDVNRSEHGHYYKDVPFDDVDIYRLLLIFNITDPCIQHAVKKLIVAGGRGGGKDISRDIKEAIDTLRRWQDMRQEDANVARIYGASA
jgi:hypothetical protein